MAEIQQGLVSTIIPVFNRPEMIVEAIDSVLNQTYRPIEIIVVDDGSTDNTKQVLTELAKQHDEIIVLSQTNSGPGAARELGLQSASGEFVQYLDSDDLLCPNKFEQQVSILRAKPECDLAYGKTKVNIIGEPPTEEIIKLTGVKIDTMFPLFLRSRWWSTSTPLHRKRICMQLGSWLSIRNEEDWEYDCRIAALGGRLAYVDDFVSITRRHDQHLSDDGGSDISKLADRCLAREKIFQHGRSYEGEISTDDWQFFAKSVFLLARQCATQNMGDSVTRMLRLAIQARGSTTAKQLIFTAIGKICGWRVAAKIANYTP